MMGNGRNPNHRNSFIDEETKVVEKKIKVEEPVVTVSQAEIQMEQLYDMNKTEQIKKLQEAGLSKKDIKKLTHEEDRVNKLFELMNK